MTNTNKKLMENYKVSRSLLTACSINHTTMAKRFIELGADINIQAEDGTTPMHIACAVNNLELVKLLINKGADVNNKNRYGESPLDFAYATGHHRVASMLLESGAVTSTDAGTMLIVAGM